ncbi:hypothetical protein D7Z54_35245, partial [Salibacterium salarium]
VELFGSMWEDLESDVVTSLAGAESKLGDVEGATQKAGDAVRDNFSTRATEVWRDFQSDLEPVGEIVLELAEEWLPKLADSLEKVTGWFNDLSEEGQQTVLAIGGISAAGRSSDIYHWNIYNGIRFSCRCSRKSNCGIRRKGRVLLKRH